VLGESLFAHETNRALWVAGAILAVLAGVYLWRRRTNGRSDAVRVGGPA
jgi:hypothetical protein